MIEKLENNEHILLMYAAGELPPEDRLEVEQMLAVDGNLREELQRLEESGRMIQDVLARLDAATLTASSEAAAVRRVSREIRRRTARRAAQAEPNVGSERRRSLWWIYPTAAAAVVILAAAIWMPRHSATPTVPFRSTPGVERYGGGYYGPMIAVYEQSWDEPDDFDVQPASDDAIAMTDSPKDTGMPVDPLNQLLLSSDAN